MMTVVVPLKSVLFFSSIRALYSLFDIFFRLTVIVLTSERKVLTLCRDEFKSFGNHADLDN